MTDDQTIPLADLDAHGLLDLYGAASPDIDSVALSYVDDRTITAVGYGGVSKGRRMATGRVAWLRRPERGELWWVQSVDGSEEALAVSWRAVEREGDGLVLWPELKTDDDLAALVAWLKGGE